MFCFPGPVLSFSITKFEPTPLILKVKYKYAVSPVSSLWSLKPFTYKVLYSLPKLNCVFSAYIPVVVLYRLPSVTSLYFSCPVVSLLPSCIIS